jgi:hypothetical protein
VEAEVTMAVVEDSVVLEVEEDLAIRLLLGLPLPITVSPPLLKLFSLILFLLRLLYSTLILILQILDQEPILSPSRRALLVSILLSSAEREERVSLHREEKELLLLELLLSLLEMF